MALSRAWLLWEQFQKKSELFRENVLLVPHGDDFRYSDAREWEKQFLNLEKLMAYINSNTEMNTKVLQGFLFTLWNSMMALIPLKFIINYLICSISKFEIHVNVYVMSCNFLAFIFMLCQNSHQIPCIIVLVLVWFVVKFRCTWLYLGMTLCQMNVHF